MDDELNVDAVGDFLAHYGVKGMKWDKKKEPLFDTTETTTTTVGVAGVNRTTGNLKTVTTDVTRGAYTRIGREATQKVSNFLDKFFGKKVSVMRGPNSSTRIKRPAVSKFLDTLFTVKSSHKVKTTYDDVKPFKTYTVDPSISTESRRRVKAINARSDAKMKAIADKHK